MEDSLNHNNCLELLSQLCTQTFPSLRQMFFYIIRSI